MVPEVQADKVDKAEAVPAEQGVARAVVLEAAAALGARADSVHRNL